MKLILDEGLPVAAAEALRRFGISATHVLDIGLGGARDAVILAEALKDNACLVTRDADFHQILAATQASGPSVIRIRIEKLNAAELAVVIANAARYLNEEVRDNAAVSVGTSHLRVRRLPLK
ncbi:MAG: DUF5615 family PIN-like protein [Planctomycetaceae bacterium]|nr:DUF5615 family PIN-like protein [Planctomycetaceae bacterium]